MQLPIHLHPAYPGPHFGMPSLPARAPTPPPPAPRPPPPFTLPLHVHPDFHGPRFGVHPQHQQSTFGYPPQQQSQYVDGLPYPQRPHHPPYQDPAFSSPPSYASSDGFPFPSTYNPHASYSRPTGFAFSTPAPAPQYCPPPGTIKNEEILAVIPQDGITPDELMRRFEHRFQLHPDIPTLFLLALVMVSNFRDGRTYRKDQQHDERDWVYDMYARPLFRLP
ncbi:hypothetical protein EDC01DRAFT_743936 [Geopyxis carbonaria]|nr:hypothetical protein EDC01DRAFT_743936 [Geopyxis carbonaria]